MWIDELDRVSESYMEYKEDRTRLMNGTTNPNKKVVSKGLVKKSPKKSALQVEEE